MNNDNDLKIKTKNETSENQEKKSQNITFGTKEKARLPHLLLTTSPFILICSNTISFRESGHVM